MAELCVVGLWATGSSFLVSSNTIKWASGEVLFSPILDQWCCLAFC